MTQVSTEGTPIFTRQYRMYPTLSAPTRATQILKLPLVSVMENTVSGSKFFVLRALSDAYESAAGTIIEMTTPVNPVYAVMDPRSCTSAAATMGGSAAARRKAALPLKSFSTSDKVALS